MLVGSSFPLVGDEEAAERSDEPEKEEVEDDEAYERAMDEDRDSTCVRFVLPVEGWAKANVAAVVAGLLFCV